MSTMKNLQIPSDASRLPVTLPALAEKKRLGEPIVMVTAYDYPSARAAEAASYAFAPGLSAAIPASQAAWLACA